MAICLALGSGELSASEGIRLFEIERSQNANVLCYDANLADPSHFSATDPIKAYWIMKARDGHKEEMTSFERNHVYGFKVQESDNQSSLVLMIHALESRPIHVSIRDGGLLTEMEMSGHLAVLEMVFVKTSHGLIPGVEWVRLSGHDPETSAPLEEVIHP